MKKLLLLLTMTLLIAGAGQSFAAAPNGEYQKICTQEQLAEHKGLKGNTLTEADFKPYCSCVSEFVSKNATNKQLNELVMDPKAKPDWLKAVEDKAMKSCLGPAPKISA
jgi:hypothetical protein